MKHSIWYFSIIIYSIIVNGCSNPENYQLQSRSFEFTYEVNILSTEGKKLEKFIYN